MASKSKSKEEEALQFLDDLDSFSPGPTSEAGNTTAPSQPGNEREAAEVLAFLDEITQKSAEPTRTTISHLEKPMSRSGTPTLRKSVERVKVGSNGPTSFLPASSSFTSASGKSEAQLSNNNEQPQQAQQSSSGAGWGWGTVWSSASAAIQQAKSAVDEQVKHLPKNEQARKWGEGVIEYAKTAQLDKLGQDFKRVGLSTLTDILNVVAPPISEHEVIQVWLSHDMRGYDGIETLVYRALARIMEQVEGGDLIVNRGEESRPRETGSGPRDINPVEGYEAAFKLAQANLDELIKHNSKPTKERSSVNPSPTTYSYVYLRVQPFMATFTLPDKADAESTSAVSLTQSNLQFILHLSDPEHQLVHSTVTQAVPGPWLELWDQYDWVEDLVAEALRIGVEVIGQEYVVARMGWGNKAETEEKSTPGTESSVAANEKATET
jgi:hypothetical protein